MNDEKYVFFQDVKEKKVTGYSARKQRSHCGKGGRVKLPSDYLTKKELKNMSGECKSYRMNSPMKWQEFKAMPDDIQETYLKILREKYNVSDTQLSKMFGTSQGTCNQYLKKKGINRTGHHSGAQAWDKEGFYAWAYGVPKAEECQSVQEEVKDERPADYVEYTHYELPIKEAEQEDVEEESMIMKLYCPCCGAEITAGQQECLNCRVYLWEVV